MGDTFFRLLAFWTAGAFESGAYDRAQAHGAVMDGSDIVAGLDQADAFARQHLADEQPLALPAYLPVRLDVARLPACLVVRRRQPSVIAAGVSFPRNRHVFRLIW